jgi:predicted phosphodiesterase
MTTLIFSDTHLPGAFDQNLFKRLKELIEAADKVIINGDFWDYHLVSWSDFLNSEWNKLFPLLKSKHAVYNFGNHDPQRLMDERMNLFSDQQGINYELNTPTQSFFIEHGNLIAPTIDESHPIVLRSKMLVSFTYKIYDYLIHQLGMTFLRFGKSKNRRMKNWAAQNLKHGQILVCGHSHTQENDIANRFINTGLIRFGYLQYLVIEDDTFRLEDKRY